MFSTLFFAVVVGLFGAFIARLGIAELWAMNLGNGQINKGMAIFKCIVGISLASLAYYLAS